MPPPTDANPFTGEFGQELEAERQAWLRRRFLWYSGFVLVTGLLWLLLWLVTWLAVPRSGTQLGPITTWLTVFTMIVTLVLFGAGFWTVWTRRHGSKWPPGRIAYWLIVISGVFTLLTGPVMSSELAPIIAASARQARETGQPAHGAINIGPGGSIRYVPSDAERATTPEGADAADEGASPAPPAGEVSASTERAAPSPAPPTTTPVRGPPEITRADRIRARSIAVIIGSASNAWGIFATHFLACLFIPWTVRECIRPLIPLVATNCVIIFAYGGWAFTQGAGNARVALTMSVVAVLGFAIGLPGAAICWWRSSRFRDRFTTQAMKGRYAEMRRELFDARRIHEALFPAACRDGPVRLEFRYEPMRQIGGDYLYCSPRRPGDQRASVVVVDVTGHGIAAALTVNRLHGELERLFAENPDVDPGAVLGLLNKYVHLTLANHSVYATAFCLRVDPARNVVEYASGGHPPAFLRAVDGTLHELSSTGFVLGACASDDFDAAPATLPFYPGDALIVYTDGAIEAKNEAGRMLGVRGVQRLLAQKGGPSPGQWPAVLMQAVDGYRSGPVCDDTLAVEVWRPLGSELTGDDAGSRSRTSAVLHAPQGAAC